MFQVGFGKTFQNLPYFDQSVAYVSEVGRVLFFSNNGYFYVLVMCALELHPGAGAQGPEFLTLPLFYFKTKDLILTFLLQFKMSTFYRCFFLLDLFYRYYFSC
jgi:hypothetical protein